MTYKEEAHYDKWAAKQVITVPKYVKGCFVRLAENDVPLGGWIEFLDNSVWDGETIALITH